LNRLPKGDAHRAWGRAEEPGRIDFLYLHVAEPRTGKARAQLGYVGTPQIMLLDASGRKVREWIGVVTDATLASGLESLLKT
jgi:hypothetical protein